MTHTAFRYDLAQQSTIVQFAAQVGSVEALQMLFVMSCADLAAVGPDALNDWKLDLLTQLYQRTDSQFRDEKPDEWFQKELESRREAVRRLVGNKENPEWWFDQIQGAPANYLFRCSPQQIVQELETLRQLSDGSPALAWAFHQVDAMLSSTPSPCAIPVNESAFFTASQELSAVKASDPRGRSPHSARRHRLGPFSRR